MRSFRPESGNEYIRNPRMNLTPSLLTSANGTAGVASGRTDDVDEGDDGGKQGRHQWLGNIKKKWVSNANGLQSMELMKLSSDDEPSEAKAKEKEEGERGNRLGGQVGSQGSEKVKKR